MEFGVKPTEYNIVLVHDRILMAVLEVSGIYPVDSFSTGWPDDDPKMVRKICMAYRQTDKLKNLIKAFERREITVNLDEYLASVFEIDGRFERIIYNPKATTGNKNG